MLVPALLSGKVLLEESAAPDDFPAPLPGGRGGKSLSLTATGLPITVPGGITNTLPHSWHDVPGWSFRVSHDPPHLGFPHGIQGSGLALDFPVPLPLPLPLLFREMGTCFHSMPALQSSCMSNV